MKLYELAQMYREFLEAYESGDIPEEAVSDTLESLDCAIEDKLDGIACLVKELEAESAAIKAEAGTLAERATAKANKAEWLRKYISMAMQSTGKDALETSRNKLTFRKSESVVTDDTFIQWAIQGHDEYLTYKDPTPNKTVIKEAIKAGQAITGAQIETKRNLQIK